ncbi:hypothetical protein CTEST_04335 [Corynebacterium testudinoris]|uniref:Uncharacterized protein n=2 Tax=Corynebacterium testudinoris TaxID=136857 RepID=A0A0G3H4I5_9CORY|nr:hypothetical protein CTEST_04335 [Corynebacterium testudinoris]
MSVSSFGSLVDQVNVVALQAQSAMIVAQQQQGGPLGPEFGKASPIGLPLLAVLGVLVIGIGWAFHRRYSRYNRRRIFAEQNGLDVFDVEAVDQAMDEAGLLDRRKQRWF